MALELELETYKAKQAELGQYEGKFALIAGADVLGTFETYADALQAGYAARKLEPFLVKKISAFETLANYTRDITDPCTVLAL